MSDLTYGRLIEVLSYDHESGLFYWRISMKGTRKGTQAGCYRRDGYYRIRIDGRLYYSHRLAWLYMYGEFPEFHVDHIDGNPSNNRIYNLRQATASENLQNQRGPSSRSTTGFLGVSKSGGRFRAVITINKQFHHIGVFDTEEEAHLAYVAAKRILHPMGVL